MTHLLSTVATLFAIAVLFAVTVIVTANITTRRVLKATEANAEKRLMALEKELVAVDQTMNQMNERLRSDACVSMQEHVDFVLMDVQRSNLIRTLAVLA